MAHRLGAAALLLMWAQAAQAEPICMEAVLQGTQGTMPLVVELATTPERHAQGLMFVEHMPLNRGMLFVFDAPGRTAFWMHNTPLALDIVPLRANGTVVETLQGVPYSTAPLVPKEAVSRILEVNAGLVATMGAGDGQGRFVLTGGAACDTVPPTGTTPGAVPGDQPSAMPTNGPPTASIPTFPATP